MMVLTVKTRAKLVSSDWSVNVNLDLSTVSQSSVGKVRKSVSGGRE